MTAHCGSKVLEYFVLKACAISMGFVFAEQTEIANNRRNNLKNTLRRSVGS